MRAYIIVCTTIFAFIAVAHSIQLTHNGGWHLHEADFVLSSLAVLGMLAWSILLLARQWRG